MIVKKVKVCTGCGHRSDIPIEPRYLSCCPDNQYVRFGEVTHIHYYSSCCD